MTLLLLAFILSALCVADAAKVPEAKPVDEVKLPSTAAEFRFGPGDRLGITVFKHPDLNGEFTVAPDGTITFPLVGRLQVAGRSFTELVTEIEAAVREYYTDAAVAVNVVEVSNQKVFIVGEVSNPSVLQITGEMTVLEALTRTGGINPNARTDNILLVRGGAESADLYLIDVDGLLAGDLSQNVQLQKMDIVVVPATTIVNVERFFRHVQGILSPFVSASQVYRNMNISGGTPIIDDSTGDGTSGQ